MHERHQAETAAQRVERVLTDLWQFADVRDVWGMAWRIRVCTEFVLRQVVAQYCLVDQPETVDCEHLRKILKANKLLSYHQDYEAETLQRLGNQGAHGRLRLHEAEATLFGAVATLRELVCSLTQERLHDRLLADRLRQVLVVRAGTENSHALTAPIASAVSPQNLAQAPLSVLLDVVGDGANAQEGLELVNHGCRIAACQALALDGKNWQALWEACADAPTAIRAWCENVNNLQGAFARQGSPAAYTPNEFEAWLRDLRRLLRDLGHVEVAALVTVAGPLAQMLRKLEGLMPVAQLLHTGHDS